MTTTNLPRGRTTAHRWAQQTAFNTAATANFFELNAYSSTFTPKRPLDDDDVLGSAGYANVTDARPAAPGVEDADGSMALPLDLTQIAWLLEALFGSVAPTNATGVYTRVFTSGGVALPLWTIEKQLATGQFEKLIGGVCKDATFPIGADKGYASVDTTWAGFQVSAPYAATAAGAPTVVPLANRMPKSSGLLKIGGTQIGRITTGSLKVTNTIDMDRYAGSVQESDVFLTKTDAALDITARYVDDTLRAYGTPGAGGFLPTPVAVEIDYVLSANLSLIFTLPAVRFEPVAVATENGGLMTQKLSGRAEVGSAAAMVTATLVNSSATPAS
jgi:hypothetical protein